MFRGLLPDQGKANLCLFVICLFVFYFSYMMPLKWQSQDLFVCFMVLWFYGPCFIYLSFLCVCLLFCLLLTITNPLQGFGMPLAGYLIHWIGARPAIATGCLIFSSGNALTYYTLNMVRRVIYHLHIALCSNF